MVVGTLRLDLLLGDVGFAERDACARAVPGRPDLELLSARQRMLDEEDL